MVIFCHGSSGKSKPLVSRVQSHGILCGDVNDAVILQQNYWHLHGIFILPRCKATSSEFKTKRLRSCWGLCTVASCKIQSGENIQHLLLYCYGTLNGNENVLSILCCLPDTLRGIPCERDLTKQYSYGTSPFPDFCFNQIFKKDLNRP